MHGKAELLYLVVGTGRSGTVSLARLLTSVGVPCSHERVFNGNDIDGAVRVLNGDGKSSACSSHCGLDDQMQPVAESSYMAVPFLDHPLLKDCAIVHVVRDPLAVIRSFLNHIRFFRDDCSERARPAEQFIRRHLPHLNLLPDAISRACYFYLRWNQMIEESIAGRRYILHPIESSPTALLAFLGIDPTATVFLDPTCNAYTKWPDHMRLESQLSDVRDEEIKACFFWKEVATLAGKYGYIYPTRFSPDLNSVPTTAPHCGRAMGPAGLSAEPLHSYPAVPKLIQENYRRYNVVQHRREFIGLHQELGQLDLTRMSDQEKLALQASGHLVVANSVADLKIRILEDQVDSAKRILPADLAQWQADGEPTRLRRRAQPAAGLLAEQSHFYSADPKLIQENYYGYNVVQHKWEFIGAHQDLGTVDLALMSEQEKGGLQASGHLLVECSVKELKIKILEGAVENPTSGFIRLLWRSAWAVTCRLARRLPTARRS
jgi:hypothetical protein